MKKYLFLAAMIMIGAANLNAASPKKGKVTPEQKGVQSINLATAEAHINFLACDELEGREAGWKGGRIAGNYIISCLKQMGLQPLFEDGYVQPFEACHAERQKRGQRWQVHPDSIANLKQGVHQSLDLRNILCKIEGTNPNEIVIIGAHYDHLGNLGRKVYYAGAHDNASGTAAIVTLAAHYAKQRPKYDMYFIAFSGEDAFLRGSEWYAKNPLVSLKQIKYLFNLDMIADNNPEQYCEFSDEAMEGFALFEKINTEKGYFKALDRHDLDENSDHWPFAKKNVPVVFFMNEHGDAYKYYHTIHDTYENHIFSNYEPTFNLIENFINKY